MSCAPRAHGGGPAQRLARWKEEERQALLAFLVYGPTGALGMEGALMVE